MILLTPYKHYYEQIDGKTIDITDEIPFDLPDSWAWCRLGILCKIKGGKRVPKGDDLLDEPTPYVYLRVTDMKAGTICDFKKKYISEETFKKIANYTISKDDVYLTIAGTIGLVGFIPEKYDGMSLTENAAKLTNISINKLFLGKILTAGYFQNIFNEKRTQVAQPKLALERVATVLFPLPPLAEQQRIVEQVETLLKYVDIIDSDAETLDKSITLAKQKILDLAIRGKLVQQDPTDEPASELLKKIKAEKDALVKAGKIKKDKHESFIFKGDDNCYYEQLNGETVDITAEIPFDLPESWSWCRLYSVVEICDNLRKPINAEERQKRIKSASNLYPYYGATGQVGWIDDFISDGEFVLLGEDGAPFLDPCTPKAYIICGKAWINNHAHVLKGINNQFLCHCLNSVDYTNFITGTTRYKLTQAEMAKILLPTPPLAEQQRIVQAIAQYNSILELISK